MAVIRLLLGLLLLALPVLADSCGDSQRSLTNKADPIIADGVYRNPDVGFEYRIPKGITSSIQNSVNEDGSYLILTGTGSSAHISLTVRNGDNTLVSPDSHLRKIAQLSGIRVGKISTLPFDRASTSEDWHRADYKTSDESGLLYNSLVSIRHGQHWLDWTFTARSQKQLRSLIASLATAKFHMSAGVSSCRDLHSITRYRVSGAVMQKYLLKNVAPVYPAGWHGKGTVVLQAAIDKNGKVTSLRVISGNNADLAESALAAARQYEYQPYTINEEPVEVDTEITFEFSDQLPSN